MNGETIFVWTALIVWLMVPASAVWVVIGGAVAKKQKQQRKGLTQAQSIELGNSICKLVRYHLRRSGDAASAITKFQGLTDLSPDVFAVSGDHRQTFRDLVDRLITEESARAYG